MNDNKIELSIIVPAYNIPEVFLSRCVSSLHAQKGNNLEFILLNDGSSFDWVDGILREAADIDDRMVYVNKPNTGVSDTRNEGMRMARGEYLMFVDADDELMPDACQKSLECIKESNADVIVLGYCFSHKEIRHNPISVIISEEEKERLLCDIVSWDTKEYTSLGLNVDAPWGKIFKKNIAEKNNIIYPVGLARSQDAIFCLYFYEYSRKIVFDNHICIYSYNDNMDSVCRSCSETSVRMLPFILGELEKFVEKHRPINKFRRAIGFRVYRGLLEAELRYFFHPKCDVPVPELKLCYKDLLNNKFVNKYLSQIRYRDIKSYKMRVCLFLQKHKLVEFLFRIKKYAYPKK